MAASMRVKRERHLGNKIINLNSRGDWREVVVDLQVFADEKFAGFSGLEELKSYDYGPRNESILLLWHQMLQVPQLHQISIQSIYWSIAAGRATGEKSKRKRKASMQTSPQPKKKKKQKKSDLSIKSKPTKETRRKKSGREIYRELLQKKKQRKVTEQKKEIQDMSAWSHLPIPTEVLLALSELGFSSPTPIQHQCLGPAIYKRSDIVGGAETGSGKTLAFGIPILDFILKLKAGKILVNKGRSTKESENDSAPDPEMTQVKSSSSNEEEWADDDLLLKDTPALVKAKVKGQEDNLYALILTPTRELAVQVKNHIAAAAKYTDIKIALVVGGMSLEKQMRILKRQPEVVVGTPGRIWELYQQFEPHLRKIISIRCLVIDEADRMVERTHFAELTEILNVVNSSPHKDQRQTLLFSATLSLVHSGPKRKIMNWKQRTRQQVLGKLMDKVGLKQTATIVDLTKKEGTVSTLLESKIFCNIDQKDIYLYYFLLQYPGRTLVFCNSIDCIRRLLSILTILQCSPYPLHSSMHQKQRLKNLERFTENPKGLLLATDVAARGLDIPNVQHVIHYQAPRTTEIYIHRSGRTARQAKQGLSVLFLSPKEIGVYRTFCKTLDKEEIATFPVDSRYFAEVLRRVELAREIDSLTHQYEKKKHKNNWFQKAAEEMDIIIDEELNPLLEDLGSSHDQKGYKAKLDALKADMKFLLKKKIFPSGYSQRYITSSGSLLQSMLEAKDKSKTAISELGQDKDFNISKEKKEVWESWKKHMKKNNSDQISGPGQKKSRNKYKHLGKKVKKVAEPKGE
ncbi:ATP-dependent RNA helicase DDX24 [Holothuria leucospilota]|uniref:ATP-dependent RNA helicase n=1 Tax=Holothuria leucospilota TaxID=206669 RepID=A0A9Q1BVR5_HOLLE|nr:ATP-dependent RNA helicase DDX24 [Holothuria leucospilota]